MRRFVGAELEHFERLFARGGRASIASADYPPCAAAKSGPLRLKKVSAGGLIVSVTRCEIESHDFRLKTLFTTGQFPFPDPIELARFWNGPLADAFGIERGPIPERLWTADERPAVLLSRRPTELRRKRLLPTPAALAGRLAQRIHGQDVALEWIASLIISQFAKRAPRRPATLLSIGPPGVGKTATLEALPTALAEEGWASSSSYRVDCSELTSAYDVHRFLGASPGLVGYTQTPPLVAALRKEGCIAIFDEIDKAHPDVQEALYGLLDSGRVMTPDGEPVNAPGSVVAMTTTANFDELDARLHRVEPANRHAVDRVAREHLLGSGWPLELISRIDTIAVFRALDAEAARGAAASAIRDLGAEYGFELVAVEQVLIDVVQDLGADSGLGARGLYYAARKLLGELFASAAVGGVERRVSLTAGPPPTLSPVID